MPGVLRGEGVSLPAAHDGATLYHSVSQSSSDEDGCSSRAKQLLSTMMDVPWFTSRRATLLAYQDEGRSLASAGLGSRLCARFGTWFGIEVTRLSSRRWIGYGVILSVCVLVYLLSAGTITQTRTHPDGTVEGKQGSK